MARRLIPLFALVSAVASAEPQGPSPAVVVQATYFHGDYRCATCLKLERWSATAIQKGLADSVRTGRLVWGIRNMDTPQGELLADQLSLTNKALVLMEMRNGRMARFKELKDTWKNLRDSSAFATYVQTETVAFLKAAR